MVVSTIAAGTGDTFWQFSDVNKSTRAPRRPVGRMASGPESPALPLFRRFRVGWKAGDGTPLIRRQVDATSPSRRAQRRRTPERREDTGSTRSNFDFPPSEMHEQERKRSTRTANCSGDQRCGFAGALGRTKRSALVAGTLGRVGDESPGRRSARRCHMGRRTAAAREPAPWMTLVRSRTAAKVDSIRLVVLRWSRCSAGKPWKAGSSSSSSAIFMTALGNFASYCLATTSCAVLRQFRPRAGSGGRRARGTGRVPGSAWPPAPVVQGTTCRGCPCRRPGGRRTTEQHRREPPPGRHERYTRPK